MPGRSIARRFAISVGVVCLVLALGIGTFFFAAQAPSMDPIVPPPANSFASDLVQRGATLAAIAEMLGMPKDKVRCIHAEGAGCYGHNAADDAAADAALLARAVPGRPVRLQWMREQEHAWEPYGPAMAVKVEAGLDASGKVIDWDYTLWSNTHATRPGPAGSLIAARSLAAPFQQPAPRPIPMPEGGGDRNSIPLYQFPSARVMHHFIPAMPVRVSALRALGAHMNVFAIESFMDELAAAAGADPVQFRLQHLDDARARDVISAVAQRFGWSDTSRRKLPGRGRGFAFARYKNLAAYCAVACEMEVKRETGHAHGACRRRRRCRPGGQSRGDYQPDRGRDFAVDELDLVRKR